MAYVAYDHALTPDKDRVVPVKQFAPTLEKALAAADAVIAAGGFFNLRIEAEDGHTIFSEAELRALPSAHTFMACNAACGRSGAGIISRRDETTPTTDRP
jgi:hypothetical protein